MQAELGANAMLAVSIAACKAGAAEKEAQYNFDLAVGFSVSFIDTFVHFLLVCSGSIV